MAGNEGGGSQPHLFETDGGFYIVKTRNNPQGERVLANELVGGLCLDWMGIKHPASAVVDIPADVITDSPSARFSDGNQLQNGLAFGSEHWQSDPGGTVDVSLIVNRADAGATLVVGTWLPQHDSRQYRLRASSTIPGRYEYIPVEQGHCFGQPGWTASELAERTDVGIRPCPLPLNTDEIRASIERLRKFQSAHAAHIVDQVPEEWLGADERLALKMYLVERAPKAAEALEVAYPAREANNAA